MTFLHSDQLHCHYPPGIQIYSLVWSVVLLIKSMACMNSLIFIKHVRNVHGPIGHFTHQYPIENLITLP